MKTISEYDDRVWSRFFDFVFPDEQELAREQVQAELRDSGVDMRPTLAKLQGMLRNIRESEDARAALESARKSRPSVVARLMGFKVPSGPVIREKLKDMIRNRLTGHQQAVYARKLEDAASDEDLRSLLEDLSRLEALSEDGEDGES